MTDFKRPSHNPSKSRASAGVNIRFPSWELFSFKHRKSLTLGDQRGLNNEEYLLVEPIFKNAIDYSRVRIVRALVANNPTVLGNLIRRWKPGRISPTILIHELGHVWQYQTKGLQYISSSACEHIKDFFNKGSTTLFAAVKIKTGTSIYGYTAEEQANIITDFYVYKQYERIVAKLSKNGKLLRTKAGKIAFQPIAESKELQIDGDDLKDTITRVNKYKGEYQRLIAEVRKTRPLSDAFLQKLRTKDYLGAGTYTKPAREKRELQPNPLIRIDF